MFKIGLTGATGSLGKVLIERNKEYKIFKFRGDIRSKRQLHHWIFKNDINIIIHLAAIVPIINVNRDQKAALDVNYLGTKNIVDVSVEKKIEWFFFSSTSHVYQSNKKKIKETDKKRPISFYGKTKYLAEKYIINILTKKQIPFCIGRIFSTANKNQKKNYLVPDLKKKIKNTKKKIILKNINHYRDFI